MITGKLKKSFFFGLWSYLTWSWGTVHTISSKHYNSRKIHQGLSGLNRGFRVKSWQGWILELLRRSRQQVQISWANTLLFVDFSSHSIVWVSSSQNEVSVGSISSENKGEYCKQEPEQSHKEVEAGPSEYKKYNSWNKTFKRGIEEQKEQSYEETILKFRVSWMSPIQYHLYKIKHR